MIVHTQQLTRVHYMCNYRTIAMHVYFSTLDNICKTCNLFRAGAPIVLESVP
jgi:hypothetical protein